MSLIEPGAALTALRPELLRLARLLTRDGDLADDLTQEALLAVWARLQAGEEIRALRPYLKTVLRNASRRHRITEQATAAAPPGHAPEAPGRLACRDVLRAVAGLPPEQARLLLLLASTGASYADLARATGLPLGTVTSRLSRARAALCATLDLPPEAPVATLLGPGAGP